MKAKLLTIFFSSLSFTVMAMIYSDYQTQNLVLSEEGFENDQNVEKVQTSSFRKMASLSKQEPISQTEQAPEPKKFKCPAPQAPEFSILEKNLQDYMWTLNIYKFVTSRDLMDERTMNSRVNLKMNANCEVILGQDEMKFNISIINLSEKYKLKNIALFRKFNNGYEILELTRIENKDNTSRYTGVTIIDSESSTHSTLQASSLIYLGNELEISGTLEVSPKELSINVQFQINGKSKSISAEVERNGQAFIVGEPGSENYMIGMANEIQDGMSLTITSGEFKGHVFEFLTENGLQLKSSRKESVQQMREAAAIEASELGDDTGITHDAAAESDVITTAQLITADAPAVIAKARGVRL